MLETPGNARTFGQLARTYAKRTPAAASAASAYAGARSTKPGCAGETTSRHTKSARLPKRASAARVTSTPAR